MHGTFAGVSVVLLTVASVAHGASIARDATSALPGAACARIADGAPTRPLGETPSGRRGSAPVDAVFADCDANRRSAREPAAARATSPSPGQGGLEPQPLLLALTAFGIAAIVRPRKSAA